MDPTALIYRFVLIAALLAPWSLACGDDDGGASDAAADVGSPGPDAADSGPDAQLTNMTVVVATINSAGDATHVMPGATVRLDPPGGLSVEGTTDNQGTVLFEDVAWTGGTASVTAHAEGYSLCSWVNLTPADDRVVLWVLTPTEPEDTVSITGSAQGIGDPTHTLHINGGVDHWQDAPGPYNVQVQRDQPFVLTAAMYDYNGQTGFGESQTFHQWTVLEHSGVSDATTINVDFGDSVPTYTATVIMDFPARADSPIRTTARAYALVTSEETNLRGTHGWPTLSDHTVDHSAFEYRMQWVEPSTLLAPRTLYYANSSEGYSDVLAHGYPVDGTLPVPLLDVPEVLTPTPIDPPHPVHAPVEVLLHEPAMDARLMLSAGDNLLWMVFTHGDASIITIPPAPSTVDEVQVLGTGTLRTVIQVIDAEPGEIHLLRVASSPEFWLYP